MSDISTDDPRRQQQVKIRWMEPGKIAHLTIDALLALLRPDEEAGS
jgi:hypothetical protein